MDRATVLRHLRAELVESLLRAQRTFLKFLEQGGCEGFVFANR